MRGTVFPLSLSAMAILSCSPDPERERELPPLTGEQAVLRAVSEYVVTQPCEDAPWAGRSGDILVLEAEWAPMPWAAESIVESSWEYSGSFTERFESPSVPKGPPDLGAPFPGMCIAPLGPWAEDWPWPDLEGFRGWLAPRRPILSKDATVAYVFAGAGVGVYGKRPGLPCMAVFQLKQTDGSWAVSEPGFYYGR